MALLNICLKNFNVASQFGKTLVVIEVPVISNVREIAYCSLFPGEGEVLFRAYELQLTQEISELGAPKTAKIIERTDLARFTEAVPSSTMTFVMHITAMPRFTCRIY